MVSIIKKEKLTKLVHLAASVLGNQTRFWLMPSIRTVMSVMMIPINHHSSSTTTFTSRISKLSLPITFLTKLSNKFKNCSDIAEQSNPNT